MQRVVILTADEYASIPINAAAMLEEAMQAAGFCIVDEKTGEKYERCRDWICGTLACWSDKLIVPWKESRFNDASKQS